MNSKTELLALLEEKRRRGNSSKLKTFKPYEWQKDFYAASKDHRQRLLMAANRVGKTYSAAYEMACHLTGDYPDWWVGATFSNPIDCWALGVSGEQMRDVIQRELFGEFNGEELDGEGAIPYDRIVQESILRSPQTRNLIKEVKIRHNTGGVSIIGLKSYSQGQHVLMGSAKDIIWIDEEPKDRTIYPQCLTRTATGNKGAGGLVMMTFTPENGMTEIVTQFMNELKRGQWLKTITWDDAPHLNEETKAQLLDAIPDYQRDMRTKGVPLMGSGLIFTVPDEQLWCDSFQIPKHYKVVNGMDFGWDHPQAHVQLAYDPDSDILYLCNEWKESRRDAIQAWASVKGWGAKVPFAWPHDGLQHEKGGGQELMRQYADAGFNMMPERATWPDGGNSVEAGVWEMHERMQNGRFKVFRTCPKFMEEKRLYHRSDKGLIVKERDDLISAARYALMMLRKSIPYGSAKKDEWGEPLITDDYYYE